MGAACVKMSSRASAVADRDAAGSVAYPGKAGATHSPQPAGAGVAPSPEARRPGPSRKPDAGNGSKLDGIRFFGGHPSGEDDVTLGAVVEACQGEMSWSCDISSYVQDGDRSLEDLPCISSEPFNLCMHGGAQWKLTWTPFDFGRETVSLYLKCTTPELLPKQGLFVSFSLGVMNNAQGHNVSMDLKHTFTAAEPDWGIQEFMLLDEVPQFQSDWTVETSFVLSEHMAGPETSAGPSSSGTNKTQANGKKDKALLVGDLNLSKDCVHVIEIASSPRIILVENFVDDSEIQTLQELAESDLKRSRVSSGLETSSRTSSGCFLTGRKETDPGVVDLEAKIAKLVAGDIFREGGRKPLKRNEALQVVKYETGEFYREHFDNKQVYPAGHPNQRAATFMMYLNDVPEGGATFFPKGVPTPALYDHLARASLVNEPGPAAAAGARKRAKSQGSPGGDERGSKFGVKAALGSGSFKKQATGLRIMPRKGRAVLFWSRMPDGEEDPASIHAAETVLGGQKWISTRWLREYDPEVEGFC